VLGHVPQILEPLAYWPGLAGNSGGVGPMAVTLFGVVVAVIVFLIGTAPRWGRRLLFDPSLWGVEALLLRLCLASPSARAHPAPSPAPTAPPPRRPPPSPPRTPHARGAGPRSPATRPPPAGPPRRPGSSPGPPPGTTPPSPSSPPCPASRDWPSRAMPSPTPA